MLRNGEGCTKNPSRAIEAFIKSSDQGHKKAHFILGRNKCDKNRIFITFCLFMQKLGVMFMRGEGCPPNQEKAFKFFKKGADRGDIEALNAIGT